MSKRYFLVLFSCLFIFFGSLHQVSATSCTTNATVKIVVKNSLGDYIKNANVSIYKQSGSELGDKLVSGNTDSVGSVVFSFDASNEVFVIKIDPPNSDNNGFYFYNETIACDDDSVITKYLGGIFFRFRGIDDELLRNEEFSVYIQKKDSDNKPIALDDYKIGDFDTTEVGSAIVYVPYKTRTINQNTEDEFLLKINHNDIDFFKYDIGVADGELTIVDYSFSGMELSFRNSENISFPSGVDIEIFNQYKSGVVGEKLKSIKTDGDGKINFEYPAGTYVAVVEGDDKFEYFWDLEIINGSVKKYILKTEEGWTSNGQYCENESNLTIAIHDLDGNNLEGFNFELYKQSVDANGNPVAGKKIKSGKIGETSITSVSFKPNPLVKYALSIYNNDYKEAKFWFYDKIQFKCGESKKISEYLPYLKVILRDADGNLVKNQRFLIYSQKYDSDNKPVKEKKDNIGSFDTSEEGSAKIYLPPYYNYGDLYASYVVVSKFGKSEYEDYNINITGNENKISEYVFSDITLTIKDANGKKYSNKTVYLYEQITDKDGGYSLGKRLDYGKTDDDGLINFKYSSGYYAVLFKDDVGGDDIFWDVYVKNKTRTYKDLITSSVRINVKNIQNMKYEDVKVYLYSLKESNSGYYKDKKIETLDLSKNEDSDISLKMGPYLAVYENHETDKEYGKAFYAKNGEIQNVDLIVKNDNLITKDKKYFLKKPESNDISCKLDGYILLQTEENGEAWYVNPSTHTRHYMKNGDSAYNIMRDFGLGISNENLEKIPVGINGKFSEQDSDGDGISDKMEEALGLNVSSDDTDGDGYKDRIELDNGYNPNGYGRLKNDKELVKRLKGKILLQIESAGEAWYLNPADGKRYYMQDGESAFQIMKFLSLGITNDNLEKIKEE